MPVQEAFVLLHKLREVIAAEQRKAQFSGVVEVDGAYFGRHVKPKNEAAERIDRRTAEEQTGKRQVVVVMRERKGAALPVVVGKESDAIPTIRERVPFGSVVHADEARGWDSEAGRLPWATREHKATSCLARRKLTNAAKLTPERQGKARQSKGPQFVTDCGHFFCNPPAFTV